MQSPSMQQFQCSLHGTERATNAVYSWPSCGGGCVQNASCIACFTACGTWGKGGAWDKCDCPDECYPEGVIADQTIRILKDKVAPGGAAGQPFFHACGFKRPHLSYRAPTKYFDMCTIASPLLSLLSVVRLPGSSVVVIIVWSFCPPPPPPLFLPLASVDSPLFGCAVRLQTT